MENEGKKDKRGGRRVGAGRPCTDSKLYSFRASGKLSKFIDSQASKTDFIKDCIEQAVAKSDFSQKHNRNIIGDIEKGLVKSIAEKGIVENRESFEQNNNRIVDFERYNSFGQVYRAKKLKDFSLPYFDVRIVAGFPIPLDNDEKAQSIDLIKMLCPHPDSSYLIRVVGNSMIEADVHSGDIIIVDKSNRKPSEKEIAVCEYNGEYTLKHFVRRNGVGYLVPANPDFPEIRISPNDDFSIWGTVTYIIHKPK